MSQEATKECEKLNTTATAFYRALDDAEQSIRRARTIGEELLPRRTSTAVRLAAALEDALPSLPFVEANGHRPDGRKQRVTALNTEPATDSYCLVLLVGGHGEAISRLEGKERLYDETVVANLKHKALGLMSEALVAGCYWLENDPRISVLVAGKSDTEEQVFVTLNSRY